MLRGVVTKLTRQHHTKMTVGFQSKVRPAEQILSSATSWSAFFVPYRELSSVRGTSGEVWVFDDTDWSMESVVAFAEAGGAHCEINGHMSVPVTDLR